MGSLMGSFTQQRLGSLSTSWVFLFQSWEISALKMPDFSALCWIFCVENMCCCSVAVSCPALCDPMYYSMPAPLSSTISWSLCQFMSISRWCYLTISSCATPFSFCLQYFWASECFPMSWLFESGSQIIGTSASVLLKNIQGWFPLGLTGLSSLLSKDSQESFPTPAFESIDSSALSLLYGPTFTSVHDYWKNHSFDNTDLCRQSDVSAF